MAFERELVEKPAVDVGVRGGIVLNQIPSASTVTDTAVPANSRATFRGTGTRSEHRRPGRDGQNSSGDRQVVRIKGYIREVKSPDPSVKAVRSYPVTGSWIVTVAPGIRPRKDHSQFPLRLSNCRSVPEQPVQLQESIKRKARLRANGVRIS